MKRISLIAAVLFCAMAANAQQRVLAHRGGRGDFEENVMETFRQSNAAGMHAFEMDVRITADGYLVISHDGNMKRMYGEDCIIEETDLSDLRALRTEHGNQIPTLDEFLDFLKDKKDLYVEFEMKTDEKYYPAEKLAGYCDLVYDKVMSAKPADALYILSSFDYRALRYLTVHHPGEDCFMLIHGDPINDKTIALAMSLGVKRMACWLNGTSRARVKEAHDKGMKVNLWPGGGIEDFVLAYSLGADYICTDYPVELMDFAKKNSDWINVKF